MARPQQLQPGQLNPQSQPVSTFIQSTPRNVAGAARPELLPQTPQLQTSQIGGTTFVQGENSFAQLAADLKAFSPQLMGTAETAGLKYVDWRMDVGEQMAMEEVQRGLAQIDESTEIAGNQRAADNRKVSAVDPQAGWLMRTLDPYQQMGYQRGKVKVAAREIEIGLPAFIETEGRKINPATITDENPKGRPFVDYQANDMGMSGIQQLQARYQLQLEAKYGINSGSPGYTKYFAPNLLRAQGRVADQALDNRTKFFESQIGPQAITETVDALNPSVLGTDDVVFTDEAGRETGRVSYLYMDDEGKSQVNPQWIVAKANEMSARFKESVARAPLGMAQQIAKDLYTETAKRYPPGSAQRKVLDAMRGPDGVSFGTRFGYLAAEADEDYYGTKAKNQKNQRQLQQTEFEDELRIQLGRGLDFTNASKSAVGEINDRLDALGLPKLTPVEVRRLEANAVNRIDEIAPGRAPANTPSGVIPPGDPQATTQFLQSLNGQSVYDIDVAGARARLQQIQQSGTYDVAAFTQASSRVDTAEKAQSAAGTWLKEYDQDMRTQIDGLIGEDSESPAQLFGDNRSAGDLSIRNELTKRMTAALKLKSQGRPLTPEEIKAEFYVQWPTLRQEILDGTFPLAGYKNTPSVNSQTLPTPIKPEPVAGSTKPQLTLGYDLDQVLNMPRRNVRLRNWRKDPSPILSAKALIQVIQDAANGRRENPQFTEAWKRAGAPNAWAFIERQMSFYNQLGGGKGWTDEDLKKAKQDLLSYVIRDGNRAATIRLAQTSPSLALLNNWAEMV